MKAKKDIVLIGKFRCRDRGLKSLLELDAELILRTRHDVIEDIKNEARVGCYLSATFRTFS